MSKIIFLTIFTIVMLLIACIILNEHSGNNKAMQEEMNYSDDGFTDITWTRETEADIEYIRFSADGSFSYYCACGNPVNDSDLCEGYTYDNKTKTIKLNCIQTTESMVTTIIIINYDENSIELDFNGDIRTFVKDKQ